MQDSFMHSQWRDRKIMLSAKLIKKSVLKLVPTYIYIFLSFGA